MVSKPVAHLMSDLGIVKSLNRPQVSNDNPFSEAQFKTLKYSPAFPERFGCREDSQSFCRQFFTWYNREHKHSGIGYYTPEDIHYGRGADMQIQRQKTLDLAYAAHPERFVKKTPSAPPIPTAVWINPPTRGDVAQGVGLERDMPKTCPQSYAPLEGSRDVSSRPVRREDIAIKEVVA